MNKFVDRRFILALLIVTVLIISQFLFRYESMGGVECIKSLTNPSAGRQVSGFSTSYGFPLTLLTSRTDGCFEEQTTRYDLAPIGFVVNTLLIGVLGTAPYWYQAIWRKSGSRQETL